MPDTISSLRRTAAVKALGLDPAGLVQIVLTPTQLIVQRLITDAHGRVKYDGDHPAVSTETFDFYNPA